MQKKIIIVGSGGHAISCVEIIKNTNKFEIIGYVDKYENKNFFDLEYLGTDDYFINNYDKSIHVFFIFSNDSLTVSFFSMTSKYS